MPVTVKVLILGIPRLASVGPMLENTELCPWNSMMRHEDYLDSNRSSFVFIPYVDK